MNASQKSEALRLADKYEAHGFLGDHRFAQEHWCKQAAAELRAQHARIAELEAQLDAIGAGGVEPLRKQTSTADVADERDAFEKWLRIKPCGAAHDFGWRRGRPAPRLPPPRQQASLQRCKLGCKQPRPMRRYTTRARWRLAPRQHRRQCRQQCLLPVNLASRVKRIGTGARRSMWRWPRPRHRNCRFTRLAICTRTPPPHTPQGECQRRLGRMPRRASASTATMSESTMPQTASQAARHANGMVTAPRKTSALTAKQKAR